MCMPWNAFFHASMHMLITYSYFQLHQSRVISFFHQLILFGDSCRQLELGRQEMRQLMMTMCLQQQLHALDMSSLCLVQRQASTLRFRSLAYCFPLLSTCRALGNTSLYPSMVLSSRSARRVDVSLACRYLYCRPHGCDAVKAYQ